MNDGLIALLTLKPYQTYSKINPKLADRLEEWAHGYIAEGKQEGLQEGKQQGEMLALQRLLAKRFGVIPMETVSLISQAPLEDIERWFDRAIDAKALPDVFED